MNHHLQSSLLLLSICLTFTHAQVHGTSLPSPLSSQSQSQSQSPSNSSSASASSLPFKLVRLSSASSAGLMTKIFKTQPDFINATYTIQRYISNVEQGIMQLLQRKVLPLSNQTLRPCNSDGIGYKGSMNGFFELRSLPEPDLNCLTVFEGIYNPSPSSKEAFRQTGEGEGEIATAAMGLNENDVYEAIIARAKSMYKNRRLIANVILGNWSSSDVNIDYSYNTTSKRCIVNHVGGVRVNEKWYIFTTVTSKPIRLLLPLKDRQWLTESIHAINQTTLSEPLLYSLKGRFTNKIVNDTTTSIEAGRGSAGPYSFNTLYPETIPALTSAIDKSDLYIQQADDALAPSSLAILILPLCLNLIPLAILTKSMTVTKSITFIYSLMTDVVTVIPLAIKGIELIIIGTTKHRSVSLRMSAAVNGTLSETAAVEVWGAQCQSKDSVLPAGIAFLCVSIGFLIIGFALEFVAKLWVDGNQSFQLIAKYKNENSDDGKAVNGALVFHDDEFYNE